MKRAARLQSTLDAYAEEFPVPAGATEGDDHPYRCRCDTCLMYWIALGEDPEVGGYGPFSKDEIEQRKKKMK